MYFKLLEIFILRTIFSNEEYNITSKNFNPIKFFTILLLIGNVFFTIFLLNQVSKLYDKVNKECPSVLIESKSEKQNNKTVDEKKVINSSKIEDKKS